MTTCPRCRTPRTGAPTCLRCGLPQPAAASPPGTITALRVLLGISVAGSAAAVLMALVAASFASSFGDAIAAGPLDDGTGTTLRGLGTGLLVLALLAAVFAAVELWAVVALAAPRRAARTAITLVQVADLLLAPVFVAVVGAEVLVPMLLSLPFGITLLVLAWVPESSRRWFDGTAPRDVDLDAPPSCSPACPSPARPRRARTDWNPDDDAPAAPQRRDGPPGRPDDPP